MPLFPDITFPPGTTHEALIDKLQRFFQPAMRYWKGSLYDVVITNPQDGDVITYDAATKKWINKQP